MMVFLHIPKTGGTTFQFILENSFGIFHCHTGHIRKKVFGQADLEFTRKIFPGLRSVAGENIINPLGLSIPDPFYMTFLREPVARVFSHYQDSVLRDNNRMTFEASLRTDEELENLHVKLMAGGRDLAKAKRFLETCGFVGLTEKFDLSLHVLERLSPHPLNLNYKRKVVARDNTIKKGLEADGRLVEMAKEYNRLDLELYSFAVNEIFPKMCARAGLGSSAPVASYDRYTSEIKPKFLLNRLYNMSFFRPICKLRNRWSVAPAVRG